VSLRRVPLRGATGCPFGSGPGFERFVVTARTRKSYKKMSENPSGAYSKWRTRIMASLAFFLKDLISFARCPATPLLYATWGLRWDSFSMGWRPVLPAPLALRSFSGQRSRPYNMLNVPLWLGLLWRGPSPTIFATSGTPHAFSQVHGCCWQPVRYVSLEDVGVAQWLDRRGREEKVRRARPILHVLDVGDSFPRARLSLRTVQGQAMVILPPARVARRDSTEEDLSHMYVREYSGFTP